MDIEIINKLDEITSLIKNDSSFIRMKELERKIENNKELISKINELKNMKEYDTSYLSLKEEILDNNDFKEYKSLEKEWYFTIQLINKELRSLIEKS